MNSLNPFELLGIDPHKSTIKQLKRAYYDFALLVHPDKNGEKDGSEMTVVQNAYIYCLEQMQNANDKETTFENLEKEFAEFCKVQESEPPPFRDITEDVLEMQKFNQEFDKDASGYKASFSGGYGDLMETSAYTESILPEYDDTDTTPLKNDFSSLIVYTEPIAVTNNIGDVWDYERKDPMDSYTVYVKKTCLTDYKEANTKQELNEEYRERTLEEILIERKHLDDALVQDDA